jgi:hypothetical protein
MIRREGGARNGYYVMFNEMDCVYDYMNLDDETKQKVISWRKKYFIISEGYLSKHEFLKLIT